MQNDIILTNKMLNELHEFLSAAQILLPEGAKCGGSIREIRYKSVFFAQPKIRIIRDCNATLCLSEKFVVVKNFVPFVPFVVVK
jgi:hypothetical protein